MFEGGKMEKTLDKNWGSIFDTFSRKDGINLISLVASSLNQRFVIVG